MTAPTSEDAEAHSPIVSFAQQHLRRGAQQTSLLLPSKHIEVFHFKVDQLSFFIFLFLARLRSGGIGVARFSFSFFSHVQVFMEKKDDIVSYKPRSSILTVKRIMVVFFP